MSNNVITKRVSIESSEFVTQHYSTMIDKGINWNSSATLEFTKFLFQSIANYIRLKRYSTKNTVFKLYDFEVGAGHDNNRKYDEGCLTRDDLTFIFGAMCNYIKPEEGEEDDAGNFYLTFTFDESDINDDDYEIHINSFEKDFITTIATTAGQKYTIVSYVYTHFVIVEIFKTLLQYLDKNAFENGVFELYYDGIFEASVIVEDGKKIFSIIPGDFIKTCIKNDSAIAK